MRKLQNIRFLVYMNIELTFDSLMINDINIPQLLSTLTGLSSTNISTMRFTVSWKHTAGYVNVVFKGTVQPKTTRIWCFWELIHSNIMTALMFSFILRKLNIW